MWRTRGPLSLSVKNPSLLSQGLHSAFAMVLEIRSSFLCLSSALASSQHVGWIFVWPSPPVHRPLGKKWVSVSLVVWRVGTQGMNEWTAIAGRAYQHPEKGKSEKARGGRKFPWGLCSPLLTTMYKVDQPGRQHGSPLCFCVAGERRRLDRPHAAAVASATHFLGAVHPPCLGRS